MPTPPFQQRETLVTKGVPVTWELYEADHAISHFRVVKGLHAAFSFYVDVEVYECTFQRGVMQRMVVFLLLKGQGAVCIYSVDEQIAPMVVAENRLPLICNGIAANFSDTDFSLALRQYVADTPHGQRTFAVHLRPTTIAR